MKKIRTIVVGYFNNKPLPEEIKDTPLGKVDYSMDPLGKYREFLSFSGNQVAALCLGCYETYQKSELMEAVNEASDYFVAGGLWVIDTMATTSLPVKEAVEVVTIELAKCQYEFHKYKTNRVTKAPYILKFYSEDKAVQTYEQEAAILAESINIARDLGNEPSNMLTPEQLADTIVQFAEEMGLPYNRHSGREALEEIGAHAILAVNQGSVLKPELISVSYQGATAEEAFTALVGKGITFDTGGYSLKTPLSMPNMKSDMCGAATMFAAFRTAVLLKLPINLVLTVASTDNVISPLAYKPDDVIQTMNGKTVEIVSTDAEGRLILADALTYVQREYQVNQILDAATLTGAAILALGDQHSAIFSNDTARVATFEQIATHEEEPVWRLPLGPIYTRGVRGAAVADITNKPQAKGGQSSYAAAFLQEFIEHDVPWIHIDIAGTAFYGVAKYGFKSGATGVMIRTLVKYLSQ